ncbi:hypothetical protein E2C01_006663 [Portunus trituberculatus]|uniref:Uncharacterized protein n=1 Tax=Portunus trituberculatus TaxID=210409 RepID=A0A5B7CXY1_PORTR|nr:hypothetical protein [Portunus trituberculatus]
MPAGVGTRITCNFTPVLTLAESRSYSRCCFANAGPGRCTGVGGCGEYHHFGGRRPLAWRVSLFPPAGGGGRPSGAYVRGLEYVTLMAARPDRGVQGTVGALRTGTRPVSCPGEDNDEEWSGCRAAGEGEQRTRQSKAEEEEEEEEGRQRQANVSVLGLDLERGA